MFVEIWAFWPKSVIDSAVTSTVSVIVETVSGALTVVVWPITTRVACLKVANPPSSTVTVYSPGGRKGRM